MNRSGAAPDRPRPTFRLFVAVAILLVILGILTMLSIGILFLPLGIAMLVATAFWERPWVVTAITSSTVAFSVAYILTAPWACSEIESATPGGEQRIVRTCSRVALPDLRGRPRGTDYALALGFAGVTATAVAMASARVGRRLATRGGPPAA